jgi:hypothetical protein
VCASPRPLSARGGGRLAPACCSPLQPSPLLLPGGPPTVTTLGRLGTLA